MKEFKENLIKAIQDYKSHLDFKLTYRKELDCLSKLEESLELLPNNFIAIKEKIKDSIEELQQSVNKKEEIYSESRYYNKRHPIDEKFLTEQENYFKREKGFYIEFVVQGTKEQIEKISEFLHENNINREFIVEDSIIKTKSYLLSFEQADLLKEYFHKNEDKIFSGLFLHLQPVNGFNIKENYNIHSDEGMLGIKANKISLRLPRNDNTIYDSIEDVMSFELTRAIELYFNKKLSKLSSETNRMVLNTNVLQKFILDNIDLDNPILNSDKRKKNKP